MKYLILKNINQKALRVMRVSVMIIHQFVSSV